MNAYVYILTNQHGNVLYIGVTNNLLRRIYEHKNKIIPGFSKRYKLTRLVYYETFDSIVSAIVREKELKRKSRIQKHALICSTNPDWNDLSEEFLC